MKQTRDTTLSEEIKRRRQRKGTPRQVDPRAFVAATVQQLEDHCADRHLAACGKVDTVARELRELRVEMFERRWMARLVRWGRGRKRAWQRYWRPLSEDEYEES